MISSNEKHINTNSIFILITEVNQHVTGETDEERCFARQYLHFWGKKKKAVFYSSSEYNGACLIYFLSMDFWPV